MSLSCSFVECFLGKRALSPSKESWSKTSCPNISIVVYLGKMLRLSCIAAYKEYKNLVSSWYNTPTKESCKVSDTRTRICVGCSR